MYLLIPTFQYADFRKGVFKVQARVCNLSNASESGKSIAGAVVFVVVVLLSTLVRIGGKFATRRQGKDDVFIMICFFLSITSFLLVILSM